MALASLHLLARIIAARPAAFAYCAAIDTFYLRVLSNKRRAQLGDNIIAENDNLGIDLGSTYFDVDPMLLPSVLRRLGEVPQQDAIVDAFDVPKRPIWLMITVKLLRSYRKHLSPLLGNRCVFEPSCSRYADMAFRRHGLWKGIRITFYRLVRCRPGNGGVDLQDLGE